MAEGGSTAVKWHWFLPTSGDGRKVTNVIDTVGQTAVTREADVEYLAEVAKAAERAGFEAVLTPTGSGCEDAWVTCMAVAQHTEKLKFIVALRPESTPTALGARPSASVRGPPRSRLLLNVVTHAVPAADKSFAHCRSDFPDGNSFGIERGVWHFMVVGHNLPRFGQQKNIRRAQGQQQAVALPQKIGRLSVSGVDLFQTGCPVGQSEPAVVFPAAP